MFPIRYTKEWRPEPDSRFPYIPIGLAKNTDRFHGTQSCGLQSNLANLFTALDQPGRADKNSVG